MSKCLIRFSILFAVICANDIFVDPCVSSTPLRVNTQGNNYYSMPPESPTRMTRKLTTPGQIQSIPTMPNGMNVNDIKADSVVAITSGSVDEAPQIFFSENGSVPFKGWVYITTGAEYLNLINSNEEQYQPNDYYQQYPQTEATQFVQTTPQNVPYQQFGNQHINSQQYPSYQQGNNPQQTNYYQNVLQQPAQRTMQPPLRNVGFQQSIGQNQNVVSQKNSINPYQPFVNRQNAQMGQPIHNKTPVVAQEVQSGRKIEQGEVDNETPEVLISDGAVYKLANSVKIADNATNNNQVPISTNTPQQVTQNMPVRPPEQIPQQMQNTQLPLANPPLNGNQTPPLQIASKIQPPVVQKQGMQNAQPTMNTPQTNVGNQSTTIANVVNPNNNPVSNTNNLNSVQSVNTNTPTTAQNNTGSSVNNQNKRRLRLRF